jgi:hypothetical protein
MAAILAAPLVGLGLSTTAATTLATAGLYIATTGASILLQMAMAEKTEQEIGTKLSAVLGGAVNQAIHVGRKETAGSFIYKGTWGVNGRVPNGFLVRIYALSDRPVIGFEDYVWVDGLKCGYDPEDTETVDGHNIGHNIPKFNASGGHRLWVKFHDGTQGSADNYLVSKFGSGAREWTNDHIGVGRAYMIVTQKYDKKAPTGEVEVTAVVKNTSLYDWRNDSTNGGSGAQRYSNQATWGTDPGNPITNAYNVMRGIYYGDEWMYGGQKWPPTRFDNDTWTAAANKCDTDVDTVGAGTIKWARQGAEIDVSEEPWAVIERMLKASNGRMVESGGKFKVYVGGIGASVYSFTDDDVILSEELTGQLFPTRDSIANTVNGTYVEPENAGEAKAYKPRSKTEYVDEDGDVRKTTMDFEYVRDNRQAQRLAAQALKENRRFRTFSLAFWSQARKLEPCDVISWTSEQYQFTAKKFIVGDVVLRDDGIVIVNVREADSADADWNPISDEDPFTTGVFEDLDEPTQTFTATVTGVPFQDDTGKDRRPAIRIEATLDDEFVDCRALRYQVRKKFHDQKIIHRGRSMAFFEPDNEDYGDITFTSNAIAVLKAKWVQVRYKIEPESDRETEWSDWADHDVNLDDIGIDDDDTSDDLLAAPTGLSVTKIQEKDEDGTIRTFLKLNCTAPGWAGEKAEFIYEVIVASDDTYRVKSKSEKARFRVNRTNRLHTVRARARNGVGQLSAWTSSVSLTPSKKGSDADAVTGISISRKNGAMIIKWDRISDPDNREVAIYRGTTNVFATMTEIGRTKGTRWRDDDNITKGTRYYYRVLPVDTSDNVGTETASVDDVETGIDDDDTDNATLAAPSGLTLTKVQDTDEDGGIRTFIKMECTAPAWATSKTTYVYSVTVGSDEFTVKSDDVKARYRVNKTNVLHTVKVRGVKGTGNKGSWSGTSTITPSKKATGAGTGAGLAITVKPKGMRLRWTRNTDNDYKETIIYRGTTNVFGSAVELDRVKGTSHLDSDELVVGTTYYYWIAHSTTSDIVGTQSSSVNAVWRKIDDDDTDDSTLSAPSGLSVTKVQDVDDDGKVETYLKLDCTAPGWANAKTTYAYSVEIGSDEFKIKSDDTKARFKVHKTGQSHTVKVRGIKGVGNKSSWSSTVALTPSKKAGGGVPAVGSITVTSKKSRIKIDWPDIDDNVYRDYKKTFIYRNTTGATPTIGVTAVHKKTSAGYYIDENVTTGVTYYYWVAHRDQSDNFSGLAAASGASGGNEVTTFTDLSGYVSSGQIGTGEVKTVNVDTSAVTTTKIAADAASSSAYVLNAGSMTVLTSQTTVVSTTANLTDNADVQIGIQFVNIDGSGRSYVADIYIGGSLVWQTGIFVPAGAMFYTAPIFSGYSGSSVSCEFRLTAATNHLISNRAIGVRPRKR